MYHLEKTSNTQISPYQKTKTLTDRFHFRTAVLVKLFLFFLFSGTVAKATTYYSYQSGNWSTANTWTTDPAGTTLLGPAVPTNSDQLVVLAGRTVSLSANVVTTGHNVNINNGGILDLSTFTITTITLLEGEGTLRIGASYFPTATTNNFITVNGGTVEYYNFGAPTTLPATPTTYYNLTLSNSTVTNYTMNLGSALTVLGNFNITATSTGTLTFGIGNDVSTSRALVFNGNVTVGALCTLNISAGSTALHTISMAGNFTINGTVDLTNNADYAANTLGAASLTFTGLSDNTVSINNVSTSFYSFIVNKGVDQTFTLNVTASVATSPFDGFNSNNMITLTKGTLRLGANITVPQMNISGNNYDLSSSQDVNAGLWIDGATVTLGGSALVVYGKFRITSGSFTVNNGQSCIVTRGPGEVLIEGGTVTIYSFRVSSAVLGTGTYTQTGGTVNVTGTTLASGYPAFCWPYSASTFVMTGGVLNVSNPGANAAATNGGIMIGSSSYTVTGGTVNVIIPSSATNFNINSTVPFWDMNISQLGAGTGNATVADQPNNTVNGVPNPVLALPLVILNDLTLISGNTIALDMTPNADQNLTVGRHFNIQSGTTYIPGSNITTFNGTSNQTFTNNGAITAGLNYLTVNKSAGTLTLAGTASATTTMLSDLTITSGTLADGGNAIDVKGNVVNSGTHTGAGMIQLSSSTASQTISGTNGVFANLKLNNTFNTAGSTMIFLTSNISVTGTLTLNQNNLFDISTYNLALGASATIAGSFGPTRFIKTSGQSSDGSITKTYSASSLTFTYPFGTNATPDYTPATITLGGTNPSAYGSITVRPVSTESALTTATGVSLTYYWRTTSSGFTLNPSTTVTHAYTYLDADIIATETEYVAGRYNPATVTWTKGTLSDVNTATNTITFNATNFGAVIDGEYTAGDDNPSGPFNAIRVFYSLNGGGFDYNNTNGDSWSLVSHTGTPTQLVPTVNDIVEIGDATYNTHNMVIDANGALAGVLKIASGCTLNIGTTAGHNFGVYAAPPSGNGTIRIASATVPAGDFVDFLGATGGTYEFYGSSYTLPSTATYYNLIINSDAGATITLPNNAVTVYGNMTTKQNAATGTTYLNVSATSRALIINGNLTVSSGILEFRNGSASAVTIGGNVAIASGAIFRVDNSAALTHTLSIGGSISNAGTFDMSTAGSDCNVTFTGTGNTGISGVGTTTNFNTLTVNKGTSQTPVLTVTSTAFTLSGAEPTLILTNGTFKLTSAVTINPTTTAFTIPATSCLSVNGGTINLSTSASDASDVFLNGKLEILAGTVNVGNVANNNNNDIEYFATGLPEIDVQGTGTLNVNGQIRRSAAIVTGILSYKQSGSSTVLIRGRNALSTRAKLEVANTGSIFNMSGTSLLNIQLGNGITFFDLYLYPGSSTITGGTIQMGNASTAAGQVFKINATVALYNLTLNTTNGPTTQMITFGLTLKNNLTIEAGATFVANSLNVTIGGNLTNSNTVAATSVTTGGYQPGSTTQVTTFNSTTANQTISGTATPNRTHFGNLVINNTFGTVTLAANTAITVNETMTLTAGILADGGNTIVALGNISNSATHTGAGNITIGAGAATTHTITGNGIGAFGNLVLNSTSGVNVTANTAINGTLTFNVAGLLYIDNKLLRLGAAASIVGADATKYIKTNGTLADAGVTKIYPTGASNFTFTIGSAGKYTPAQFNVTANTDVTGGTITVKPVNTKHPTTTDASNKELAYYWNVNSTGFASGLTVTHVYNYINADVNGTEASYVAGRFYSGGWNTVPEASTAVTPVSDFFTFTAKNYISGDYTTGEASEFSTIRTFYSLTSGNWDNPGGNVWSYSSGGAPVAAIPVGNPVVIEPGHTITVNTDSKSAISVTFTNSTGILDLGSTIGHSFGTVSGTGTIKQSATAGGTYVFPAGTFTSFIAAAGGTFEFGGSTNGTLSSQSTFNNIMLTGTATKTIAADMTINGNLTINAGILKNTTNNKNITLNGNWINNVGASGFTCGTGTVTCNGSSAQQMTNTGGETFYNLAIANSAGDITLNNTANVTGTLNFTSGKIILGANDLVVSSGNAITGYGAGSYVVTNSTGSLKINNLTTARTFPVGKNTSSFTPATIANVTGTADQFAVRVAANVLHDGTSGAIVTGDAIGLTWFLDEAVIGGSIATISFQWNGSDELSGFDRNDCHISHYSGGLWDNPASVVASGSDPYTVSRSGITSFSPFGVEEATPHPLPIELLFFDAQLTTGKIVELSWATASETNNDYFTIEKTRDGSSFEKVADVRGAGNSRARIQYNTFDNDPYEGYAYYRLKQTDFDGKFVYSKLVGIDNSSAEQYDFTIFPNPSSDGMINVNIKGNEADRGTIIITDLLGRTIYSKAFLLTDNHNTVISLDPPGHLPPGIYQVSLQLNEKYLSQKMVVR
jgi:fibronectin-binding autotransporter adhesin